MIDFDDITQQKKIDYKIIIVIIIAFLFAYYVYDLMFGQHSYIRLLDLQRECKTLQHHVKKLKNDNEKLQKEYFELKELEGGE